MRDGERNRTPPAVAHEQYATLVEVMHAPLVEEAHVVCTLARRVIEIACDAGDRS
jgi:hypothetical protein